jgi:hypothetical protein
VNSSKAKQQRQKQKSIDMIKQANFLGESRLLLVTLLCCSAFVAQAAAGVVLTPVVDVKGSASWAGRGSTKSGALRAGESLAEGSTILTGADSRVMFSPVPGITVSVAKNTSVSLLRLNVTKSGGTIQKRDAVLKLDIGTLSFSLDKRSAGSTSLVVETPRGTMNADGSVGTITVVGLCVKIASLSGKITFTPSAATVTQTSISTKPGESSALRAPHSSATASRAPIVIEPGWFLAACGEGPNAQIRVINTIARTWTNFSADGTPLGTRAATVQELESTRGFFEATLEHAALAVSYGLLSAEGAADITQTLTQINQSFAAVGLAPIETPAIGTSSGGTRSTSVEGTPGSGGFSGGSLNPANTVGEVISREQ